MDAQSSCRILFNWLDKTRGTIVKTYKSNDYYYIYVKNKNKPLAILKRMITEKI